MIMTIQSSINMTWETVPTPCKCHKNVQSWMYVVPNFSLQWFCSLLDIAIKAGYKAQGFQGLMNRLICTGWGPHVSASVNAKHLIWCTLRICLLAGRCQAYGGCLQWSILCLRTMFLLLLRVCLWNNQPMHCQGSRAWKCSLNLIGKTALQCFEGHANSVFKKVWSDICCTSTSFAI